MERTYVELRAWAARARTDARRTCAQARKTRAAVQAARASRRRTRAPAAAGQPLPLTDHDGQLPLEAAAERALLRELTAREIAGLIHVPVGAVLHTVQERAIQNGRSVDDTLRTWFHVLLTCTEHAETE